VTYGRQKLAVEQNLSTKTGPWTIVRLTKVISDNPDEDHLLSQWLRQIIRGEEIHAAGDQFFSPIDVNDAGAALISVAEKSLQGCWHLGGPERCNRLEMLDALATALRSHSPSVTPRIVPRSIRDFPFLEARPLDTSLCSDKLMRVLGMEFTDVATLCRRFTARLRGNCPA
jgi:dTDP-4-dehydrorhamnose reductase